MFTQITTYALIVITLLGCGLSSCIDVVDIYAGASIESQGTDECSDNTHRSILKSELIVQYTPDEPSKYKST
jgi:hypothetical protein